MKSRIGVLFGETSGAPAEPRGALVTPARFAGLVLLGCGVLLLRRPEGLLAPEFFAEDGAILFKGAFEHSFWKSLTLPHAGYPELLPRLVAALVNCLPLALAPALYAGVSLAIASIALSWIALPQFRHWIPSDAVRCYLVLLLWVAPNQEALMKLSYVQWYLCFWVALCAVMRPLRPVAGAALAAACIASFWSTPASYVLLPLFALRIACLRASRARLEGLAVLVGGVAAVASAWWFPWGATFSLDAPGVSAAVRFEGLVAGLFYIVVAVGVLGESLAGELLGLGPAAVLVAALAGVLGVTWLAVRRGRAAAALVGVCLYVMLSTCALFVLRTPLVAGYAEGRGLGGSDRYFFVASCFALVLIVALAAPAAARHRRSLLAAGLALLALHGAGFRMRSWTPSPYDWPRQVERIEAARKRADATGRAVQLVIPIDPEPWMIRLHIAPRFRGAEG